MSKKRLLVLEDGHVFEGIGFGGNDFKMGEIVFHTGMMGYQDVISDMSYYGQIVLMTYPMIGNFGINRDGFESIEPAVFGFVVGEYCEKPNNWRCEMSFDEFLSLKKIPGIADIDTRMLAKLIRKNGTMKAIMCEADADVDAVVKMLQETELPKDQVKCVSTSRAFAIPNRGEKIVLMDMGAKNDILRELNMRNMNITVVPYTISAEEILALRPQGVVISNGPGNPKDVPEAIETIQKLMGKVPMFGICLGHQLIALACGADTVKLTFGHRGGNHPVINLANGKAEITTQNHSYAVDENSLEGTGLVVTHTALNDKSVEGLKHETYPLFSVQFYPEASNSADEINYLYKQFYQMVETCKRGM